MTDSTTLLEVIEGRLGRELHSEDARRQLGSVTVLEYCTYVLQGGPKSTGPKSTPREMMPPAWDDHAASLARSFHDRFRDAGRMLQKRHGKPPRPLWARGERSPTSPAVLEDAHDSLTGVRPSDLPPADEFTKAGRRIRKKLEGGAEGEMAEEERERGVRGMAGHDGDPTPPDALAEAYDRILDGWA